MNPFISKLREAFDLQRDKEFFHRIRESIEKAIPFRGANLYILIFAVLICSLGLDVNSTAVIIGAMLISPLMGPIIGMGFALGTTNWDLLLTAGRNYLIATAIALLSSTFYFLISPLNLAQSELLLRTQPTIYDVLIAFFGGFAGILATASKQKGNVIPGAAIATALMPPLCTAGFGLAEMNSTYLLGALYLYVINTVFIGMATFLACRLLNLPARQTEPDNIRKARKLSIIIALITFIPSAYLGVTLYRKTQFINNANHFIDNTCRLKDNHLFSSSIDYDNKTIELVYGGSAIPDSIKQEIVGKKDNYRLANAKVRFIESFSKPISHINQGLRDVHRQIDQRDIRINELSNRIYPIEERVRLTQTQVALCRAIDRKDTVR